MSGDEILLDTEERMEKAISVLKSSPSGIRTGRANPDSWIRASRSTARKCPSSS